MAPLREDHVTQACADEFCDVLPGGLDGLLGLPAVGMLQARGVAETLREERQHRVDDLRVAGRGRVGVEVQAGHGITPNAGR